ncbi:MAG: type I-D CRISPR-associated protein Cas10d/Csc3 [Caldilineaceae bacterium]
MIPISATQDAELSEIDEIDATIGDVEEEPHDPIAPITLAAEPLFSSLLRSAVDRLWPGDAVMHDFVTLIAPKLSNELGEQPAKGGDFFLMKLAEAGEGNDNERVFDYQDDQSMRAHLINGLFPVLHVAKTLKNWGAPQMRSYDDRVRRLFIAGYILHDWLKLDGVDEELARHGLQHDRVNAVLHLPIVETIFHQWCQRLGLDQFLAALGDLEELLQDLIYIACNTQIKWGTLRNLAALPKLRTHPRQLALAENLSRLADYLAYLGRNSRQVVAHLGIHRQISMLSDQSAELFYHHIAEVRGVLTNLIQNAALAELQSNDCVPLLFAPTGVVYLTRKTTTPTLDLAQLADAVVAEVKKVAGQRLQLSLTGFGRDGKGIKHADYYDLFFDKLEMLVIALNASSKLIHEGKKPSAGKRFDKMAKGQWLDPDVDLALPDDVRVDQMAEWCYIAERIARDLPGGKGAARILIEAMGLEELYATFLEVPRDARAGGVGYHWYFAAGNFLKRNPGRDPEQWQEEMRGLARQLIAFLTEEKNKSEQATASIDDGFADLRQYVQQVVTIGAAKSEATATLTRQSLFGLELERYSTAKKRGPNAMCSLCSSPYTVDKQQESAILFAPQVYSNKLTLHGSTAIRNICSVCGLETMLRQLLMNRTNSTGGRFEGRNLRYLYFYPTYFFTPETLAMFQSAYIRLRRVSFTELRKQLVDESGEVPAVQFDAKTWQRLEPVMLTPRQEVNPEEDRYLRLHFADNMPITFFFMGVPPPGRDSKDAEAWVHPAFLALLLPLCVDVKVIASESTMPLMNEANELHETVFLDGAHAAIGYITGQERINVDHVLSTLNRLATAYLIHMDGNSSTGAGGYDYRWQDLPALARSLNESSLFAFHYLKKWQRKAGADGIPEAKAALYLQLYHILDPKGDDMTRAEALTTKYRQFYRTRSFKTHAVVRPLSIAAEALLNADKNFWNEPEALVQVVHGRLYTRIRQLFREKLAYPPQGSSVEEQDAAMADFACYFVEEVYGKAFRHDLAALSGKQLNLIKNACEVLYRVAESQYWRERKAAGVIEDEEPIDDVLDD